MEFNEACKIVFGFDISNLEELCHNTKAVCLFKNLSEARELKQALDVLKEKFGWKENFVIYRHGRESSNHRGFSVDTEALAERTLVADLVKVE